LNKAIYPHRSKYRHSRPAPLCPEFGPATVLRRPADYDGMSEASVKPGAHTAENGTHSVVWWDPSLLRLHVDVSFGLRQEGILTEDPGGQAAAQSVESYGRWKASREEAGERGVIPSLNVIVPTGAAEPPSDFSNRVQVARVVRGSGRPSGTRFGSLVHAILRDVEFRANREAVGRLARTHARLLNATEEEIEAATEAVDAALRHPLLERARKASHTYRELPVLMHHNGSVVEAVIDLAFVENDRWSVVDFKTDAEDRQRLRKYCRQVGWYIHLVEKVKGGPTDGWVLHL
jgi:hypothetical protein